MKARIPEFDYIRGIAMIMVVMGHVLLFSFHINNSALLAIISICEMPLFFTVSGYLSHKEKVETVSSTLYRLILSIKGSSCASRGMVVGVECRSR